MGGRGREGGRMGVEDVVVWEPEGGGGKGEAAREAARMEWKEKQ